MVIFLNEMHINHYQKSTNKEMIMHVSYAPFIIIKIFCYFSSRDFIIESLKFHHRDQIYFEAISLTLVYM